MAWLSTMGLLGGRNGSCEGGSWAQGHALPGLCQPYQELTSPALPDFGQEGQSQVPSINSTGASCQRHRQQQKPCLTLKKLPTSSQLSPKGEFTSLEGVKPTGCAQDPAVSVGGQGIYNLLASYTVGLSSPCWREMLLSHTVTGKAEFLL